MSIGDTHVGLTGVCSFRQLAVLPLATGTALLSGGASAPPLLAHINVVPDEQKEIFWVRTYLSKKGVLGTGQVRIRDDPGLEPHRRSPP